MKNGNGKKSVQDRLDEGAVLKALQEGSREAVRMNKLLGYPVSTVRDGKVIWIPPEEIQIDGPASNPAH